MPCLAYSLGNEDEDAKYDHGLGSIREGNDKMHSQFQESTAIYRIRIRSWYYMLRPGYIVERCALPLFFREDVAVWQVLRCQACATLNGMRGLSCRLGVL